MKKKLGAILLVVALALALALPAAPVGAASDSMTVVSDTTTQVIGGNTGTFPRAASFAWEPGPLYPNDGPNDTAWQANSLWDKNLTGYTFSASADWIWEDYRVVNPVAGDVVDFRKTFYIPGYPTLGTLYITCDNGYEVYVNGNGAPAPGGMSAQLGAGWRTSNLRESFVNTSDWQSVESWDISAHLQPGLNVIEIGCANEEMTQGVDGHTANGTQSSNPAGLIFEMDIEYEVPDIDKGLVCSEPDLTLDTNDNDIDEVDLGTEYCFLMVIEVENDTGEDMDDVLVHDRLGAELELVALWVEGSWWDADDPPASVDAYTKGNSDKWFIDWTIAELDDGDTEYLALWACLDENPGGKPNKPNQGKPNAKSHQEYTSPGIYDLNSGATIVNGYFDGFFVEFEDLQSDPIQVEVLEVLPSPFYGILAPAQWLPAPSKHLIFCHASP